MKSRPLVLLALLMTTWACGGGQAPSSSSPTAFATARATATPAPTPTPQTPLTLTGLFHPQGDSPQASSHLRTVIATGDIIPARLVNVEASRRGDYAWPFRPTADFVKNADVTYINLESPLLQGCVPDGRPSLTFCGDPRWTQGLQMIGTKVVNVANNHVNSGRPVTETKALLEQNGMKVTTDLGPPVVLDVKGLKIAFVGCRAVENGQVDRAQLKAVIQQARQLAQVVVVQFHWGKEYERQPMIAPGVAPDQPTELGHLAIDSGADLVVGNHPHWVQGVEVYHGHLITYAHGNYVFDQVNCYPGIGSDYRTYCSDDTRTSVIGTYTFYDDKLVSASWKPTYTDASLQTQWADSDRSQKVLKTMEDASVQLAQGQGEPTA